MNPEVLVGSVRRRRRSPKPDIPRPPNLRNLVIYIVLTVGVAALMFNGYLTDRPDTLPLPLLSQTTDVRSTIWESGDSLQIEIGWDLTISEPQGVPDSIRVRVVQDSNEVLTLIQAGTELADTASIPAPEPGTMVKGLSCVAAHHGVEQPVEEACAAWQYVRPFATAGATAGRTLLQPGGLQANHRRQWPLCQAAQPFAGFSVSGQPHRRIGMDRPQRQGSGGTVLCEQQSLLR